MDVVTSLANAGRTDIRVIGGRYGLASKDTPPASVFAVYKELAKANPKRQFNPSASSTTSPSSPCARPPLRTPLRRGTVSCMFWGLGGDGTVGANKNSIKIIGDHTDKYVRPTSSTTPRRPAASRSATCASATSPSRARTTSTRPTSWPATTRATSPRLQDGPEAQGRRHLPRQQPVDLRGARAPSRRRRPSATSRRTRLSS